MIKKRVNHKRHPSVVETWTYDPVMPWIPWTVRASEEREEVGSPDRQLSGLQYCVFVTNVHRGSPKTLLIFSGR